MRPDNDLLRAADDLDMARGLFTGIASAAVLLILAGLIALALAGGFNEPDPAAGTAQYAQRADH